MHLSPLDTHVGLLIRTWTRYSEPGQPRPHAEQAAHMRNRRPTCGTGGPHAEQGAQPYTRPATSHVDPLHRTWTRYSEPGQPRPHAEQAAHVRNRGFTRGTAAGGPAWGHPYYMPARRSPALCVSVAGRRRSLRGSCPWRGRRGLPRAPRRRCPRASRPKR